MYTKEQILTQLSSFAKPGAPILIHSSLKSVGEVEGRGEALLELLIEYFTQNGGMLCIPTHTWGCKHGDIALDLASDETCVGMLTRLAALHPLAHRSHHPTHSMAVFDGTPDGTPGRAEDFIACEANRAPGTLSATNPDGCYGKLFDRGGKIMLVGVGHNRNTYLHSVEEMLDVPNRLTKKQISYKIRLKSGEELETPVYCHSAEGIGDVSSHYPKYEPAFRKYGAIIDGKLGDAQVQLCDARLMAHVVRLIRERSGGVELMSDDSPIDVRYYR